MQLKCFPLQFMRVYQKLLEQFFLIILLENDCNFKLFTAFQCNWQRDYKASEGSYH